MEAWALAGRLDRQVWGGVAGIGVGKLGCTWMLQALIFEGADSAPPDAGHTRGLQQDTHRRGCHRAGTRSGTWAGRTREAPLVLQQHLGCDRSSCGHSVIKLTGGMSY